MTSISIPQSIIPANPQSRFAGKARLSFLGIVSSEWLKARTMLSCLVCAILFLGAMAGFGLVFGAANNVLKSGALGDEMSAELGSDAMYSMGSNPMYMVFVQMFPLIVSVFAALLITTEYGSGQIRSTLTAAPRRTAVLLGKTVVASVMSLVLSSVGLVISTAIFQAFVDEPFKVTATDGRMLLQSLFFGLVCTWIAVGLGAMVRSTAGAIGIGIGLQIVLPSIVQMVVVATSYEWVAVIYRVLPSCVILDILKPNPDYAYGGLWGGNAILLAWGLAFLIGGLVVMNRRDA
jgi:ABC-2 type transport system permease protein